MALLDYLITEGKEPIPGMNYIYRLDMMWEPEKLGHIDIVKNTIVNNVVKLMNKNGTPHGYQFTIFGGSDKIYRCNYAWAFAEYTPQNMKKLKRLEKKERELKELETYCNELRNNLDTLR